MADELYEAPKHPYAAALLSAVPQAEGDGVVRRHRIVLTGDVPSPVNPPPGCPFLSNRRGSDAGSCVGSEGTERSECGYRSSPFRCSRVPPAASHETTSQSAAGAKASRFWKDRPFKDT